MGLAHQAEGESAGRAVFVPFTLPGESVEARLEESKGGFADAELVQVLEPSSDRAMPGCAHFGECGGCHLQHASYKAQLDLKAAVLQETMGVPALQTCRRSMFMQASRGGIAIAYGFV